MAKTKINKLILILMLIIMAFCFCACGSVNSLITRNDDGTIDEIVTITLREEEIENTNYELEKIKNDVRTTALFEIEKIITILNNKVTVDLLTAPLDKITALNGFYNGISAIDSDWKENELMVGIRFKNEQVYNYFYNIPGNSVNEPEIEEHFFYSKRIYKGNTLYLRHRTLYQNLKAQFEVLYPALIDSENGKLFYTYVSDLRRQHSDADYVTYANGKYYHSWELDIENPDKEITIYYNILNRPNCILVAISASLLLVVVLSAIGIFIIKKNKSKTI